MQNHTQKWWLGNAKRKAWKGQEKGSWSKRVHIKKHKNCKRKPKNKQNAKQQLKNVKQKRTKRTKNAHAQPNFTHHLFCAIFFDVCAFYVRFFFCSVCTFCAFFVRFVAIFCVFSRKRTKKKKRKKTQIQSKISKGKDQNVFVRICFAVWLRLFCIVCAFLLHLLCHFLCVCFALFVRFFASFQWTFFHFFCVFFAFQGILWWLVFAFSVHFFRDWFCIMFAFFMFCCVIRTSFSVHHKSRASGAADESNYKIVAVFSPWKRHRCTFVLYFWPPKFRERTITGLLCLI